LSRGYKENLVNHVNPVKKVPPQAAKFIRTQDDSGSITLEVMARGFGQQPVKT
jgi:hypothetical protein